MPTIIGTEPTTGVCMCPRSHTQLFILILYFYLLAICSVLLYAIKTPPPHKTSGFVSLEAFKMYYVMRESACLHRESVTLYF